MLAMRNRSTHMKSMTAEKNYRRLRQFDILTMILLGVMAILAIWNLLELGGMFRSGVPDLAEISVISEHPSSRFMIIVGFIALAVVIFKEWKYGERSLGLIYLLVPMLFLGLIPTVSAELQENPRDKNLEFTLTRCEPGGIVEGELVDPDKCAIVDLAAENVYLIDKNPADGDFELHPPVATHQGGGQWTVTGVGDYRVHFIVRQESGQTCADSIFTTNLGSQDVQQPVCIEHGNATWSVHSMVTNYMDNGWLVVYQQLP